MIYRALKYPWRIARKKLADWKTYRFVADRAENNLQDDSFEFDAFRNKILGFLNSLKTDESGVRFKYSHAASCPTLYASAYACMTYSLLNRLDDIQPATKLNWISYFNTFQSAEDGLFYDEAVENEYYNNSDWWGARHLAVHMISAYTQLGAKPAYPFGFLKPFYDLTFLDGFLRENEKFFIGRMDNDFDNKLMNIASLLQYQRDFWADKSAGDAIRHIQKFLLDRLNPDTGIWGDSIINDPISRSRKVQFAYHLFPLFWYDNIFSFDYKKITEVTLLTQNKFGGFGVQPNSSACDDIDSVDILVRFAKFSGRYDSQLIESLKRAMTWNLLNQVADGGLVFRLNEPFTYGHQELSSGKNQGAVFPTWFRTLNMAYLCKGLDIPSDFKTTRCPGYEF